MKELARDSLDRKKVHDTLLLLTKRIEERFPHSGLKEVCDELLNVSRDIDKDLDFIARPNWWVRGGVISFVCAVLLVLGYGATQTRLVKGGLTLVEFIQIAESCLNDVVLIGAAILFMVSFEMRGKRQRVIAAVNRLRSIAHVVDMHQLTKDPSVLLLADERTAHSPDRPLSVPLLGRYLDYCSEILSLISKVGFCYVQEFPDPEAAKAINELDSLTSDLSRKIWQKIMLLHREPAQEK